MVSDSVQAVLLFVSGVYYMEQILNPTFFTQICQTRDTLAMIAALSAVFYQ